MSNTITVDTTKLEVYSVCVFQANRAEVQRVIPIELEAGQNEIMIEKLPNNIDKDSIRVEGLGNAVIFDVIYSPPPSNSKPSPDSPHQQAYNASLKKINKLKNQKTTLDEQGKVLSSYSKLLQAGKADVSALSDFLKLYEEKRREIFKEILGVKGELEVVEEEASEQRKALQEDDVGQKRKVKVTVIVLASDKGRAELSLHYVVSGASWSPLYDLRATITGAGKEQEPSIQLQYRASITQSTGEDWNDVALSLSTATPQLGSNIPTLSTYRIGKVKIPPRSPTMKEKRRKSAKTESYAAMREVEEDEESDDYMGFALFDEGPFPQPPRMAAIQATAVEGATSSTFAITGNSSIPSDGDDGSQQHKVSIAVIDLQAKLEWIAVPKVQAVAFLRCQVKNTSGYMLLPGPSSVFMDGNFVCKSAIGSVSPQESFSASLGTDPAVRITYYNVQKRTRSSKGGLLASKFDVTSFTQRIAIKNTRLRNVSTLFVKDQVPTSEDSDYKVEVTEPAQLGVAKERLEVRVASGVRARWSYKDTEEGNKGTEEDGVVEWVCDIPAGKAVDLALAWDVIAPVGRPWVHR